MGIELKTVQKTHEINNRLHEHSRDYHHSKPVVSSRSAFVMPDKKTKHEFDIIYDLKDLFTIGAITHSSVLMTGGTDVGKTTLAKLVMNSLFGEEEQNWHRIDVDTDFGKDAMQDVDFGAMTEGGKLSELYSIYDFLTYPGLILDEINRTHAALANKLLHVFDKDISLSNGTRAQLGHRTNRGYHYQFQIAAINEGTGYGGTFEMDQAMRRRAVIEIPMNIFPPTEHDRLQIRQSRGGKITLSNTKNHLEEVLEAYTALTDGISLHPLADMFIAYLEAFDYCKNSLTGEKGGVEWKSGNITRICAPQENMGCEFLRAFDNELCPNVRGITSGITKNLISVSKGFAALRATKVADLLQDFATGEPDRQSRYVIQNPDKFERSLRDYVGHKGLNKTELAKQALLKYVSDLSVRQEDVRAAFGFVAYSKIGLNQGWVAKHYQGNRYEGVQVFLDAAEKKFNEGLLRHGSDKLVALLEGADAPDDILEIKEYCKHENPWLWRVILPHIERQNGDHVASYSLPVLYGGTGDESE